MIYRLFHRKVRRQHFSIQAGYTPMDQGSFGFSYVVRPKCLVLSVDLECGPLWLSFSTVEDVK